jgi:ferredoxin
MQNIVTGIGSPALANWEKSMASAKRIVAVCSCEDTMPLDEKAIARGCKDGDIRLARHLCRSQFGVFEELLDEGRPLTVGCTQEAPLFDEAASEAGFSETLTFANIRETAGWSSEARLSGAKMAALLAAATVEAPPAAVVPLKSEGVILIYGRDETALDAADMLRDILDVTVMLTGPQAVPPRRVSQFPVVKGKIAKVSGHLGTFELTIDDYAQPAPSSRRQFVFGPARSGAVSRCDLILDLSGGTPLFPSPDLRQGYFRADPANAAAVQKAVFDAAQLIGEFDKPRFVKYTESLCAHSRSRRTGCTRCLEVCPAGAITPNGDHVAISAELCMGCGSCASVCPTGAAAYDYPPSTTLLSRLRAMLLAYADAGGREPVILVHDSEHGDALIDALARYGDGLPANVLPVCVNEVTQTGLDALVASFAYGATAVRVLTRAKPKHDLTALYRALGYANAVLIGLGYGDGLCATIETDDPDRLADALAHIPARAGGGTQAQFLPLGTGRNLLKFAMGELYRAAPQKTDRIPMPAGAPFGGLAVDTDGCTLCLACVSACPTSALTANEERPMLRFAEDLCVQCGLCRTTCPEKVIALEPRVDFAAWAAGPIVVKQEEPFHCISCGKAFGTKSTIERIAAKLEGKHWMFTGENAKRIAVIRMCDDCRVEAVMNESFDPHGAPERPMVRTTEDYLREREAAGEKDPVS